jgi:hypothetical protein
MMSNAYEKIDGAIMTGINAGVRSWNWITGETKTDLANKVLMLGTITAIVTSGLSRLESLAYSPMYLGVTHLFQKIFNNNEKRENNANEKECLDMNVINDRHTYKFLGPIFFAGAALASSLCYSPESESRKVVWTGATINMSSFGTSFYIMRADSLPPRKNCVSRGLEKLIRAYQSSRREPELAQTFARI